MAARDERHEQIVRILRNDGEASVAALGTSLGVTEMTIRRDLERLEAAGVLKRFHGGARLSLGSSYEPPLSVREKTNAAQKRAVAALAASSVTDGDTVILDGGSTGLAIAETLTERHLTVCPLSLRVAWVLAESSTIKLLLPPGLVRFDERSISGPETAEYLMQHRYDAYLMTASGVSLSSGFTEWNVEDAAVKRAALRAARKTIATVDSSKYGHEGFVVVCPVDRPNVIVCDDGLSAFQLQDLTGASQAVLVAPA